MAHNDDNYSVKPGNPQQDDSLYLESDEAFSATPIVNSSPQAPYDSPALRVMQSHASVQRSSSIIKEQASALSRQLSTKSNDSLDKNHQAIASVLSEDQGHGRADSTDSLDKSGNLSPSNSERSSRSVKSVMSLKTTGHYPLGTLRVHSPTKVTTSNQFEYDCLKDGGIVVIRDIAPGTIIGYDTVSLTIGQKGKFEGIKNIPAGAHFVWAGSSSTSLRQGFWLLLEHGPGEFGEIIVKHWDSYNEVLGDEVSLAESRIQRQELLSYVDQLKPYNVTDGAGSLGPNIWVDLTSSMRAALLNKITMKKWNQWLVSSNHDSKPEIPGAQSTLNFVFPKDSRTYASGVYGRERTDQAMDTSSHILAIISGNCSNEDWDEIIGEVQFAYLTGMLLGNLACLEHWVHVVKIVFKAYRLALELPGFMVKFVKAVHTQLLYDDGAMEGSILDHDDNLPSELKMILTVFKSRLCELLLGQGSHITPEQSSVGKAFEDLESWLWKWNWDLRGNYVRSGQIQLEDGEFVDAELRDFEDEDERGEYAPVVVELDETGREADRIHF